MLLLIISGILLFLAAFSVYSKISCGICKSSKHLVGKVVIVTGGNAGLGFETAIDLADRGARVILACRNEGRGTAARDLIVAATGNQDVHYRPLDLSSLASVRQFSDSIIKTEKRLDILINNAGILYESKQDKTEDGLLTVMQTNHFGPFLLTRLLLSKLKTSAPSRIITVSSIAHIVRRTVDFSNLNAEKKKKKPIDVYGSSKLCNILMTMELARQLKGTGVTANSLHPGVVLTDLLYTLPEMKFVIPLFRPLFKTPWEGAQTSIYLAVAPEVASTSGRYFKDCQEAQPSKPAKDAELARKLWEVSEKIVNLK